MQAEIRLIREKKLLGKHRTMSLTNYPVGELWQSFMPKLSAIHHAVSRDLFSISIYAPTHFSAFSPANLFEKWAAIEVSDFEEVPEGLETFILPEGLYAVFLYKGNQQGIAEAYRYIYTVWLPESGYRLDQRPHFELLGPRYRKDDPSSEEELWIPVAAAL